MFVHFGRTSAVDVWNFSVNFSVEGVISRIFIWSHYECKYKSNLAKINSDVKLILKFVALSFFHTAMYIIVKIDYENTENEGWGSWFRKLLIGWRQIWIGLRRQMKDAQMNCSQWDQ